jgi:hypothetical protein
MIKIITVISITFVLILLIYIIGKKYINAYNNNKPNEIYNRLNNFTNNIIIKILNFPKVAKILMSDIDNFTQSINRTDKIVKNIQDKVNIISDDIYLLDSEINKFNNAINNVKNASITNITSRINNVITSKNSLSKKIDDFSKSLKDIINVYKNDKYIISLLNNNVKNLIWKANLLNENINIDSLTDKINSKIVKAPPTL